MRINNLIRITLEAERKWQLARTHPQGAELKARERAEAVAAARGRNAGRLAAASDRHISKTKTRRRAARRRESVGIEMARQKATRPVTDKVNEPRAISAGEQDREVSQLTANLQAISRRERRGGGMSDRRNAGYVYKPPTEKQVKARLEQTGEGPRQRGCHEAAAFLQRVRPGGPWVLTTFAPDGKTTTTITATASDEVRDFVRANNGKRNLYYSVNPTRKVVNKKAAKVDIAAIEYLLADLDPEDDERSDDAKARYLEALEFYEPEPTAIVNSGNGIQLLWKLREPIDIGRYPPVRDKEGKLVLAPEAASLVCNVEARVKTLMLALGSKAGTQNIDRILRLPGTTNLPTPTKIKAGRVACPTK